MAHDAADVAACRDQAPTARKATCDGLIHATHSKRTGSVDVFCGGLDPLITSDVLHEAFKDARCADACVIMDAAGRSRGYGFLAFHRHEDAENAVATLQGKLVGSRRVKLGWSRRDDPLPPVDSSIVDRADPTNRAIYVRNIAPDASEQEISGHFSKFGAIVKIRLFKRGLLSSFGFVEFEDHAEAVQAIVHSDGKELHGRVIRCCWSKQQPGGSMPMPGAQLPAPPSDLAFTNATATAASSLSALSGVNPWLLGSNAAPPPNPSNFALLAAAASLPGGGHSMWQHGHSGMQAQSTAASLGMQHRDATSAFMPGSLFSMHPSSLATALGAASQQAQYWDALAALVNPYPMWHHGLPALAGSSAPYNMDLAAALHMPAMASALETSGPFPMPR